MSAYFEDYQGWLTAADVAEWEDDAYEAEEAYRMAQEEAEYEAYVQQQEDMLYEDLYPEEWDDGYDTPEFLAGDDV